MSLSNKDQNIEFLSKDPVLLHEQTIPTLNYFSPGILVDRVMVVGQSSIHHCYAQFSLCSHQVTNSLSLLHDPSSWLQSLSGHNVVI